MNTLLKLIAIVCFSGFLAFLSEKNESVQPNDHQKIVQFKAKKSNSKIDLLVEAAKKQVGGKYQYGGESPNGFDCSGFTQYIFKEIKIELARSASEQSKQGKKIRVDKAKKGDLLFFGGKKSITHVGIVVSEYDESLTIIHAATTQGIVTTNIATSKYWKSKMKLAKRLF